MEIALWVIGGMVSAVGAMVAGIGAYERRHRKQIEALGRRRKDQIQL